MVAAQDLITKMGAFTAFYGCYQVYLVIKKTGFAISPVLIFELFGVGKLLNTLHR